MGCELGIKTGGLPAYKVMPFPPMFDVMNLIQKSTYNYINALRVADGECIIVEDDIRFSSMFLENAEQVKKSNFKRTIVALYSAWDWTPKVRDHLQCMIPYPIDKFFGTQAMYYTSDVVHDLANFMNEHVGKEAYDMLIKSFCRLNPDVKLLATRYSVVQHIGGESTGLGYHHTTGNFVP